VEQPQADPVPAPSPPEGILDRALALVEFLRAHCPWDAAQTPASLQRHLLEEAYEVVDSIARNDDTGLREELGDLLLNLAFQVVLAEERGAFDRRDVVQGLEHKMQRRHPHLYGLGDAEPWENIKARERSERAQVAGAAGGMLEGLSVGVDPLRYAQRIQERVAHVGFDWPDARGAWEKVREEIAEVGAELDTGTPDALQEEIGDLLFSVVNLSRRAGGDAPTALARANAKFARRFAALERLAREQNLLLGEASLEELDTLWHRVKAGE
jgi:ATP diphosphatase